LLLLLLLLHDILNVLLLLSGCSCCCAYLLALLVGFRGDTWPRHMSTSPVHHLDPLSQQVLQCLIFFVEDVQVMIWVFSCLLSVISLPLGVELRGLKLLSHHHGVCPTCAGSIAGSSLLCHLLLL